MTFVQYMGVLVIFGVALGIIALGVGIIRTFIKMITGDDDDQRGPYGR